MNFLTINGKPQTHNGKFITVPDGYNDELIKVDGKILNTNGGTIYQTNEPIGKKHRINRVYLFAFNLSNEKILGQYVFDNINIDTSDDFIVPAKTFSNLFSTPMRDFPPEEIALNLKAIFLDDKDGEIFYIDIDTNGNDVDNVFIRFFEDKYSPLNDNFCAIGNLNNVIISTASIDSAFCTFSNNNNILGYATILFENFPPTKTKQIGYFLGQYIPSEFNLKTMKVTDSSTGWKRLSTNKKGSKISFFKATNSSSFNICAMDSNYNVLRVMPIQITFDTNDHVYSLKWLQ